MSLHLLGQWNLHRFQNAVANQENAESPGRLGDDGSWSKNPIELVVSSVQNSNPSVKRTIECGGNTTPASGEKVAGHVIMLFGNLPVARM